MQSTFTVENMNQFDNSHRLFSRRNLVIIPVAIMFLASMLLSISAVHAQSPDFNISATPSVLCANPGINAASTVSLQSVGNYAGTVNLGVNVSPTMSNGPTLSSTPSSETLAAGQTSSFNLTISTTTSTPLYTYSIDISGFDGSTYHQATIYLTVAAGCSVGGVIVPAAGIAATTTSYLAYGAIIAGLVGIVGATMAVYVSHRKPNPSL